MYARFRLRRLEYFIWDVVRRVSLFQESKIRSATVLRSSGALFVAQQVGQQPQAEPCPSSFYIPGTTLRHASCGPLAGGRCPNPFPWRDPKSPASDPHHKRQTAATVAWTDPSHHPSCPAIHLL